MAMISWKTLPAWQPFTFGGVAAFARSGWRRLWLVQTVVAGLVALAVVIFLGRAWFPVVTQAAAALPAEGAISGGELHWPNNPVTVLAESQFLGIVVDLDESGEAGQLADLQLRLGKARVRISSLLGYVAFPYPAGWSLALDRGDVEPWWGAWRPALLVLAGVATMISLGVQWLALGAVHAVPIRLLASLLNREVSWSKCWRLGCAALLPGAVWMATAIVLHALEQMSLTALGFAFGLHIALGWIYVVGVAFRLPRPGSPQNPFQSPAAATPQGSGGAGKPGGNPFKQ